jgi:hypothetical protein
MKSLFLALLLAIGCRADVIFSNLTGTDCSCGLGNTAVGAMFTPKTNYVVTGATAYLTNDDPADGTDSVQVSIFSNVSSLPGEQLGGAGQFIFPITPSYPPPQPVLVSTLFPNPITVEAGVSYWLVITGSELEEFTWEGAGSTAVPVAYTIDIDIYWNAVGSQALQFEVDGSATTPEPTGYCFVGIALIGITWIAKRKVLHVVAARPFHRFSPNRMKLK